jgi:hypothetical protein
MPTAIPWTWSVRSGTFAASAMQPLSQSPRVAIARRSGCDGHALPHLGPRTCRHQSSVRPSVDARAPVHHSRDRRWLGRIVLQHAEPSKQTEEPDRDVLAGLVERVTFHNAENGFCVLRVKARGHRDLITVVGHAATISAGAWLTASGDWVNDRTQGQQFKARFLRCSGPISATGR